MINATALLAAVGDGSAFAKGRDLAARLGLTPRQHSTGGRTKLLGISKRGNKYLRTRADRRMDAPTAHPNVAFVALAAKLARIVWAVLWRGRAFAYQARSVS